MEGVDSIRVQCLNSWEGPDGLTADFKRTLFNRSLWGEELTLAMERLAAHHLIVLNADPGGVEVDGIPQISRDRERSLYLVKELASGTFGTVWTAAFTRNGRSERVVAKFTTENGEDAALIMEMLIQSVLHCIMSDQVHNPVPAIVAPVQIEDRVGAVMTNAGRPLHAYLTRHSDALFEAIGMLAQQLLRLQHRASFRHADLHPGNVLIRQVPPYTFDYENDFEILEMETTMQVSIIDFGQTCLRFNGKELRVENQGDNVYSDQCDANNDASDMFLLLARLAIQQNGERLPPHTMAFRFFVLDTVALASGHSVHEVEDWQDTPEDVLAVYTMAKTARVCTPEYVIQKCIFDRETQDQTLAVQL